MHNRDAQLDAQLIEAAQGYVDSKRLDKLDTWLRGNPDWRSIEAYMNDAIGTVGPRAFTLRELINKL